MLSILLPAWNESAGIGLLLERIGRALGSRAAYRIVVIDDASTDGTAEAAEALSGSLPVVVLRHPDNRGYGAALSTGFRSQAPTCDTLFTMDADDSHDPSLIPVMLEKLRSGDDIVIASRFQPGGRAVGVPWHRRALSGGASLAFRALCPLAGVRDYTSGYRGYRSGLIEDLIAAHGVESFIEEAGFTAGVELLLKARALGARASEVPLVLRYDRKQSASKMRIGRTAGSALSQLARHVLDPVPVRPRERAADSRHRAATP